MNDNGKLFADPHIILNRRENFFNHVLHVHEFHDIWQLDIRTAEALVPEPSLAEMEIAIGY
jgi:hypothetical protein